MYREKFDGYLDSSFLYTRKLRNPSGTKPLRGDPWSKLNHYDTHLIQGTREGGQVIEWRRNSYTGQIQDLRPAPLNYWGVDIPQQNPVGLFFYEPFEVPDSADVSNAAMAKLFSRVRDQKGSDFDGGLAVAEMGQTWNLLASTAARINRSYSALRRGRIREAYQTLHASVRGVRDVKPPRGDYTHWRDGATASPGEVARWRDRHLEWTYGAKPLLDDVYHAAEKLALTLAGNPIISRVQARHSERKTSETLVRPFVQDVQVETRLTYVTYVKMQHVLNFRFEDGMASHMESLGLLNPVHLAWQTLPTSFVFDWMFNIGSWLRNQTAFFGLSFHSGCSSRSGDITRTYNYGPMTQQILNSYQYYDGSGALQSLNYLGYYRNQASGKLTLKTGGFVRDLWSEFPDVPMPRLTLPAKESTALSKLVSSLEMLHQRRTLIKSEGVPPIYRDIPIRRNS